MDNQNHRGHLMTNTRLAALFASAALPMAAHCADAGSPGKSADAPAAVTDPTVGEIVVTAQYRTEKLQAVPLSVTAVSGKSLIDNQISDFSDLARLTPGFVSAPNYGFIRNSSMRGIANNQFGFGDDPSIAVLVDDVYQGRGGTGMIENAFYDVDHVEIIKGPQATLYGRSSIAGAINTLLNQPVAGVTGGDITVGTGERDRALVQGDVNLPITSNLTLRLAGDYENQSGYLKNLNGGANLDPISVEAARAILRYQNDTGLDVSLRIGGEERRTSGSVYQAVGLPKFTVSSTLLGPQDYSVFGIADAVLRIAAPITTGLRATATTSYRDVSNRYVEDYDAEAAVVGGPYYQKSRDKLFEQDLILNYTSGRLTVVGGGTFFTEGQHDWVGNYVNETFAFTGAPDPGSPGYAAALFEDGFFHGNFYGGSGFVDVTYEILPRLKVTGGVRYNVDHKTFTQDIPNPASLPQSPLIYPGAYYNWGYYTSTPITSAKTWYDTSFRAAVEYALSDDLNLYASFNQGWKAGGIDSFKVQTTQPFTYFYGLDAVAYGGTPNVYNPERSDSGEIGAKGYFLDHKLNINLSLYDYEYRDLQVSVQQGGSSIIENVGRAVGRGFEAEAHALPVKWLDLFANTAFNFTRITQFAQIPDQVGLPLNQAPQWTTAGGGTVTAPLGEARGALALGAVVSYHSSYRNDNDLTNGVGAQTVTNLHLTWTAASGRYSVEAFLDNVFDVETYARYNYATPFLFPVASRSVLGPPRTFGVNIKAHFGS
jgi:iron complex outermembrane receptor protein